MPDCLHLVKMLATRCSKSVGEVAQTMISSTIFRAYGKPSMTTSDLLHHTSELGARPIGALRYTYRPEGSRNVVYFLLSLSNSTWKYPWTASSLAKYLSPGGIACNISLVQGKGWTGRLMNLFSCVKSVTSLTPPFGFCTKKPGLIHSVGSSILAMIPCLTSFLIRMLASFCMACGMVLAVSLRAGLEPGTRSIFIGGPFIGATFMSSVNVFENLATRRFFISTISFSLTGRYVDTGIAWIGVRGLLGRGNDG